MIGTARQIRFFWKRFFSFLLTATVPLLAFGIISIFIARSFVTTDIERINKKLLNQLSSTIEFTFYQLDALLLTFSSSTRMHTAIENIYKEPTYYDLTFVLFIQDVLNTQINGRIFIDSIYIYYDRFPDRLLTAPNGFVMLDSFPDNKWLNEYQSNSSNNLWASARSIRRYEFEKTQKKVVTIFRRLFTDQSSGNNGALLLNIEKDLFDNLMTEVSSFKNQQIYLFDQNDNLIISNQEDTADYKTVLNKAGPLSLDSFNQVRIDGKRYLIFKTFSTLYNWKIVSIIPYSQFFTIPILLTKLFVFLIIVSIAIQALLTYLLIQRNTRRIRDITQLIEYAESGLEFEKKTKVIQNEYDVIVNSLIKTFIKQKYTRLQLSERKYRNMTLELQALRSQINPHFLFNTLESIYWMVAGLSSGSNDASDMIKDLSEILKYGLEDRGQVYIEDEIRYAASYLEIMQKRYKDKFTVEWDYDESIEGNRAIKMLLQPILENCIYHGFQDTSGKHKITITIVKTDGDLSITITDDGKGIEPDILKKIHDNLELTDQKDNKSIGLFNCNRRIQLVFGEKYGISIKSRMVNNSKTETSVLIRLPVTN